MDGDRWLYQADPAGLVPPTAGDPMVRSEGILRRVGDVREPQSWLAAFELAHAQS